MKTHATVRHFITGISLAAVLAMPLVDSRAQDKPNASGKESEGYDLVIQNGLLLKGDHASVPATLSIVVEKLRERYTDANIVCMPEVRDLAIPDVKLRAANLSEMLQALRAASGDKFDWYGPNSPVPNMMSTPASIDPATGLPVASPNNQNAGLWILRPPEQASQNARVMEAFNLEAFIKTRMRQPGQVGWDELQHAKFSAEMGDMVQNLIVDTLSGYDHVNTDEAKKKLEFRFHPGANLLVVIGQKQDVEVARRVINALTFGHGGGLFSVGSGGADFSLPSGALPQVGALISAPSAFPRKPEDANSSGDSERLTVKAFPLKNIDPGAAVQAAGAMLRDPHSSAVFDKRAETLVVIATREEMVAVRAAIEEMEAAARHDTGPQAAQPATRPPATPPRANPNQ